MRQKTIEARTGDSGGSIFARPVAVAFSPVTLRVRDSLLLNSIRAPSRLMNLSPTLASTYLQQALESIHAPAGAVMLAASAIDAMLKTKGYQEGSLFTRINQAAEAHLITREMAEWAHEIRLDANDQRHADVNQPLPDETQAKKCVDFALALAEFLFVLPARVQRGRTQ
jgi:Domain of unknown function (DUF4145)